MQYILIYLITINFMAFIVYGVDKYKAVSGQWRIPESTLIAFAAMGGAAGALSGMLIWHHKTRKWKFRILVPLFLMVWIVVAVILRCGIV